MSSDSKTHRDLRPFPFQEADLAEARLLPGVRHTLAHFSHWRDQNASAIAEHVEQYTAQLRRLASGDPSFLNRRRRLIAEMHYFGVYNLSEPIPRASIIRIARTVEGKIQSTLARLPENLKRTYAQHGIAGIIELLEQSFPSLANAPETRWLAERMQRLHRSLPETVVRQGAMGKVARTVAGVLAIAAYDTLDADRSERTAHLRRTLPGAYAYGATYAIVDDTMHDLSGYLPEPERAQAHDLITRGLATGLPVDPDAVPDHPLAEELYLLYELLLEIYPFDRYKVLYHAAHSMYLAQHRDASRTVQSAAGLTLPDIYPDIFVKAGMSRVIANLLARRNLPANFYARSLNTTFMSQFNDDLRDQATDEAAQRLTTFTFPTSNAQTNPLYDLFAYSAYVVSEVFAGDPIAAEAFARGGASKLGLHLAGNRAHTERLLARYEATREIERFLTTASNGVSEQSKDYLRTYDRTLNEQVAQLSMHRKQTRLDARTFVLDRMEYINGVLVRYGIPHDDTNILSRIGWYTLGGPGKRLRAALTLMLAEGLAVDYSAFEPLIAAGELFHNASLMFDDLPAQDNARTRRGKPAAHLVFDEGAVQLSAIAMISYGFGLLAQLDASYPAPRVLEVLSYIGTVLGPAKLCHGQQLDLSLARNEAVPERELILTMYQLKTSTMLEAALVPLMILLERPQNEIEIIRQYAHHAGIVFQIRDDLLDNQTSDDIGKVNLVQVHGAPEAQRIMATHLEAATSACTRMPFDSELLKGAVHHFASRRR